MKAIVWPRLREELSLHPGPSGEDGWPTWILRDPVRNRFFSIDWPGFEILARWSLGSPERIAQAVNDETTLSVDDKDVLRLASVLIQGHLVQAQEAPATARLLSAAAREKESPLTWLLHHYLFFRIPLVRPDRFLDRTVDYVGWMGSTPFRLATIAAMVIGLMALSHQWDLFAATMVDTFTPLGILTYGLSLMAAKVAHEFSHAYTAKRLGCRVPTMGIAFLVMWPMLYTDVNDAWLLPRRRDRMMVAGAGVAAELTLAIWATLAWSLLDDGTARQMAFILATTTWVSSVLINLSPFMRFDGYFMAMDAFGIPNLHPRSFALARWRLREMLFDLREEPPESFKKSRQWGLTVFALAVWTYRLVIFLGIAALVYHFFIKAVGILLFMVEMGWFVLRPFWVEFREWYRRRDILFRHGRGKVTLALAVALILAAMIPWPSRIGVPAVLQAERHLSLYPPAAARVEEIRVTEGLRVAAGDVLFRLASPDTVERRDDAVRKANLIQQALDASGFDPLLQSRNLSLREELRAAVAQRLSAEKEIERLTITAPAAGRVTDMMPDLKPGQWLSPKEKLAAIVGGDHAVLTAYVSEDEVELLTEGNRARFVPAAPGYASITATVTSIERTALKSLDVPSLASVAGGPIAVRVGGRALVPEQALFRVRLSTDASLPAAELIGAARLENAGGTLVARLWRRLTRLLVRESGA